MIQAVTLYTLNLWYVNKTGGKKYNKKTVEKEESTVPGKNSISINVSQINEQKGEKEPWKFNWILMGWISELLGSNATKNIQIIKKLF